MKQTPRWIENRTNIEELYESLTALESRVEHLEKLEKVIILLAENQAAILSNLRHTHPQFNLTKWSKRSKRVTALIEEVADGVDKGIP